MTDLEKFVALYRDFGIECVVIPGDTTQSIRLSESDYLTDSPTTSEKFDGYAGFYTEIVFDLNGKFINQGFWE